MPEDSNSLPAEIISLCEDSTTPVSHICTEEPDWLENAPGYAQNIACTLPELISSNSSEKKIEHLLVYRAFIAADRTATLPMLAQLRDQRCKLIHIGLEIKQTDTENTILPQDLVALGFTCIRKHKYEYYDFNLFRFSLYDYKRTPDWLNSRFWANPDQWDKTRW